MSTTGGYFPSACWWYLGLLLHIVLLGNPARAQEDGSDADRIEVRIAAEGFSQAWNRGDAGGVASHLGEEVSLIAPRGDSNPQESHNRVAGQRRGSTRATQFRPNIADIDFPTANIAVLSGTYCRMARAPAARPLKRPVEAPFILTLQRMSDEWKIVEVRLYRPSEKKLALRDAHDRRYPFVESAEAVPIADSPAVREAHARDLHALSLARSAAAALAAGH